MRRARGQAGFTLIELLVAITISGLLMGAIAQAIATGLRSTTAIGESVADSHDVQMVTAWFARDVSGSQLVWGGPAPAGTAPACGATTGAQRTVLTMAAGDSASPTLVSYVVTRSGSNLQLVRTVCRGSAVGPATADPPVIVVHGLGGLPTSATANCGVAGACAASQALPAVVTLSIAEATGFTFAATGRSRTNGGG